MLMIMMMMLMMLIRHRKNDPSSCSLFTMRMIGGLDYYIAVRQVRVGMIWWWWWWRRWCVRSNCIPSHYILQYYLSWNVPARCCMVMMWGWFMHWIQMSLITLPLLQDLPENYLRPFVCTRECRWLRRWHGIIEHQVHIQHVSYPPLNSVCAPCMLDPLLMMFW